jgi:hypothetical protein
MAVPDGNAATQFLTARAMPHMERISRRLRESCHLTIVVQNHMLVVTRAEGNADVMLAVRIGATAGGIALECGPAPIRAGNDVDAIRGATP